MTFNDLIEEINTAKAHLDQVQECVQKVSGYANTSEVETAEQEIDQLQSSLDDVINRLQELRDDVV